MSKSFKSSSKDIFHEKELLIENIDNNKEYLIKIEILKSKKSLEQNQLLKQLKSIKTKTDLLSFSTIQEQYYYNNSIIY